MLPHHRKEFPERFRRTLSLRRCQQRRPKMNLSDITLSKPICHVCQVETESYMKVEKDIDLKVVICSQSCLESFRKTRQRVKKHKIIRYPVNAPQ